MNGWLLKTEPAEYAFEDLVREGKTIWDGVTNPLALKHLRAIRKGDDLLIYHTGNVRAIVGLAKAASDPYPDPAKNDPKLAVVDVAPPGRPRRWRRTGWRPRLRTRSPRPCSR
ncbi:MAG: EVE domain-containing protein [candidate division NC10 bacterium]